MLADNLLLTYFFQQILLNLRPNFVYKRLNDVLFSDGIN